MKKLVIFDLDGTLLNTIADLAKSTNRALSQLGFPIHDTDAYKLFVGNGIDIMFRRALPEEARTEENVCRMRELFLPYYNEHNRDETAPYPGIIELITELHEKGVKTAVASNKYHFGAVEVIRSYFSNVKFDVVFGHREGYRPKPDPSIVFDILASCGITDKSSVLYVGDTSIDMQTAKNANVASVAVTWGFRSEKELLSNNPDFLVHDTNQLRDIIFD